MSTYVMITNVTANTTGEKIKADGYYGYADGLHTIAVYTTGFTGKFYLQGTLASEPTEADWFDIYLNNSIAYLDYTTSTAVAGHTFQGNFIYLRAKVADVAAGTLSKALLKI